MKGRLIDYLVCPETGEPLTLRVEKAEGDEILEGELNSAGGRRYPISAGVPRMLLPDLLDAGQGLTGQTFSSKWQRAPNFGT
jgi:uncharacterized protein YbaR (Trm112 family)